MSVIVSNARVCKESYVVFFDLNLQIETGKKVVVYYRSGDGATMLCKLVCGLVLPESGEVFVFGKKSNPKNANISFLPKDQLFLERRSALANLLWAAEVLEKQTSKSRVLMLLKKYSIDENKKPKKMDSFERLRLAFARCELLEKPVLVADDIFAGLDEKQQKIAMDLFLKLVKEKTVLFLCSNEVVWPKGFERKCLSFGKIYDVPHDKQKAEVFFARRICDPTESAVVAQVENDGENLILQTDEKTFELNIEQEKKLRDKNLMKF